ncbi:MAG TPA: oligopeptide/dipeptide ABC transporter ATP-binding protein [Nocardioidaceae bacterium]|nr:oligopeptide/dipeptide ABC transporter ATP-binding protein [Nocardioidaceae bacterium]
MPTKPEVQGSAAGPAHGDPIMSLRDVEVHYQLRGGTFARLFGLDTGTVKAVDGVSVELRKGEVLGLVGESGSGKTTLGRALLGLVAATKGTIEYDGQDLGSLSDGKLRALRRDLQMVFQDPHAALNPSMDIETAVGHPLRIHGLASKDDLRQRVADALDRVGLTPPERFLTKYPSDLSGGQKQRAVLARAIILDPVLLVADEPVSALDMSVRAKILQLMLDLKTELDLTYVYITHDLASAKFFCDRVAIMYLGRIVEIGSTEEIFADPKHPYTKSLLQAIPEPDPDRSLPRDLPRGEIPDAASPPLGCSFHPRCPAAFDMCGWESRDLKTLIEGHWLRRGEDAFDGEQNTVRSLDELDEPSHQALLRAGRGSSGAAVEQLLREARADDPDEPLWRGVREQRTGTDGVEVDFYEGEDPGLRPAGGVDVACHLYPPR